MIEVVGQPHRLANRRMLVRRALRGWGFDALVVPGRGVFKDHAPLEWLVGPLPPTRPVRLVLTSQRAVGLTLGEADAVAIQSSNPDLDVRVVADFASAYSAVWTSGEEPVIVGVPGLDRLLPMTEQVGVSVANDGAGMRTVIDDGGRVDEVQAIKGPAEQAGIRHAAQVAAQAFAVVVGAVRVGATPLELAAIGHGAARRMGAREVLFYVCDGLHHGQIPSSDPLQPGALVTIYSEVLGPSGYWAEEIGMIALGHLDTRLNHLAMAANDALKACERALVPGGSTHQLIQAARRATPRGGDVEPAGSPGVAHGVGVGDADWPVFADSDQCFVEGMTVVLHPNVSDRRVGVSAAAGGTYLIREGGPERLAPVPVLAHIDL